MKDRSASPLTDGGASALRLLANIYGLPGADVIPGDSERDPIFEKAKERVREGVKKLLNDQRFCKELQTISSLKSDQRLQDLLGFVLPLYAYLAVPRRGRDRQKVFEQLWTHGAGKTWKALKDWPARLRRLADEIEKVNKAQFVSPLIFIKADEVKPRLVAGHFRRLPGVLRLYAASMDLLVKKMIPGIQQELFPTPRGHSSCLFDLSNLVKAITGRVHDREVCDLLNAAASVLGEPESFEETLLVQARRRRPALPT